LYPSKTRLRLLADVDAGNVYKDGQGRAIGTEGVVTARIAEMERAGWIALDGARWKATGTAPGDVEAAAATPAPVVMSADVAAWIAEHVLGAKRVANYGPLTCACQWSPCGHCNAGRCGSCARDRHAFRPMPETWISDRRGMVLTGKSEVWLADRTCIYRCPCPKEHLAQLDLTGKPVRPPRRRTPGVSGRELNPAPSQYEPGTLFDLTPAGALVEGFEMNGGVQESMLALLES
jgi:hypothetical protein